VAVKAVVGDVEFCVGEPLRVRVVPLFHPVPGLEPLEIAGDPVPEPIGVSQELLVGTVVVAYPGPFLVTGIGQIILPFLKFDIEFLGHSFTPY